MCFIYKVLLARVTQLRGHVGFEGMWHLAPYCLQVDHLQILEFQRGFTCLALIHWLIIRHYSGLFCPGLVYIISYVDHGELSRAVCDLEKASSWNGTVC